MSELSPKTQRVLQLANDAVDALPLDASPVSFSLVMIAAALRASADQLGYCMGLDEGDEHLVVDVDDLLALANEIDPR
jgi:hypothetical protein